MTVPSRLRRGCAAAQLQGGDSGGAFYAIDSSGRAWIRGNVIATNGVTGYAQPYMTVASRYGVSIVTG